MKKSKLKIIGAVVAAVSVIAAIATIKVIASDSSKEQPTLPEPESEATSEPLANQPKAEKTQAEAKAFPVNMLGKTVEELYQAYGEPQKVNACGLGGGANDIGYYYSGYTFFVLYDNAIINDINNPDYSGIINHIIITDGAFSDKIKTGMSHSEIAKNIELSKYTRDDMSGEYFASATFTQNGEEWTLFVDNAEGKTDSPCKQFRILKTVDGSLDTTSLSVNHAVCNVTGSVKEGNDSLAVYKEPNSDSEVLTRIDSGKCVKISAQSAAGDWYEVYMRSIIDDAYDVGYIKAEQIEIGK